MIRKNYLYLLITVLLSITSCSDPWDARQDKGVIPDKTVLQLLSEDSRYSQFLGLLKETGSDSVLQRNTSFTVFAVPNEFISDLSGSTLAEKTDIVKYHLSNFILYTGEIKNGSTLKTLNGKRLSFSLSGTGILVNDESELLSTNLIATNGVVHEINSIQQVRPNLLEYIESNQEYSYVADYFAEGTELVFDQDNSIPIGIDDDGQTVYDSIFKRSNDFFVTTADLSSEDEQYTVFLATNTMLDTTAEGSYKSGYISKLGNFIINGLVFESDLPGTFTAVDGISLNIVEGNYSEPEKLSNGWVYSLNNFQGIKIPGKVIWEITDISDFDSVRYVKATEYASIYDQLKQLEVSDLDGEFINLKYDFDPTAMNGDYLKIITQTGTKVTLSIKLPDLVPGNYMVKMGGVKRGAGGLGFDAYLNDNEIATGLNMNGGQLTWEIIDIGKASIASEKGNVLIIKITGGTRGYIDYFVFEPVN